uniref:Secreted protein n=1 Tax=Heterorhabditis bacteriophora TaxID=37862 RepID=A0A1I7WGR0_HETBA
MSLCQLWTLLHPILHTVVFEAPMPQVLRIPTMLVVLFDNFPFFTVIQLARSSTTLLCTIFFLVTQEIHNSLRGALDDIGTPLHRYFNLTSFKHDPLISQFAFFSLNNAKIWEVCYHFETMKSGMVIFYEKFSRLLHPNSKKLDQSDHREQKKRQKKQNVLSF